MLRNKKECLWETQPVKNCPGNSVLLLAASLNLVSHILSIFPHHSQVTSFKGEYNRTYSSAPWPHEKVKTMAPSAAMYKCADGCSAHSYISTLVHVSAKLPKIFEFIYFKGLIFFQYYFFVKFYKFIHIYFNQ